MADKLVCNECDEEINGMVVWHRPFGKMMQEDGQTFRFIAQASAKEMENSVPLHPECFEFRTGHKWPPESK